MSEIREGSLFINSALCTVKDAFEEEDVRVAGQNQDFGSMGSIALAYMHTMHISTKKSSNFAPRCSLMGLTLRSVFVWFYSVFEYFPL